MPNCGDLRDLLRGTPTAGEEIEETIVESQRLITKPEEYQHENCGDDRHIVGEACFLDERCVVDNTLVILCALALVPLPGSGLCAKETQGTLTPRCMAFQS